MKKILSKILIIICMISLFVPVIGVKNAKAEDVGTISISVDKTELEKGETATCSEDILIF